MEKRIPKMVSTEKKWEKDTEGLIWDSYFKLCGLQGRPLHTRAFRS